MTRNATSPFYKAVNTILLSGLVAGILDSIAGIVVYYIYFGLNPIQVLQFIASGVWGPSAIGGGALMLAAGMFFHFLIAYVVAVIYFFAYPRIGIMRRHLVSIGAVYGAGVWFVMNLLVLPLSDIPKSDFDAGLAAVGIIWHMILVGVPVAVITARHYSASRQS